MADKSDKRDKPVLDALDLQIIAVRKDNPRATIREISDKTNIPRSTVWDRLCKIGESDWIIDARNEALALLPVAIAVYAASMGDKGDRLSAARDLMHGLGVLSTRTENINRNTSVPATREELLDAFDKLCTADQDRLIADLEAKAGGAPESDG